MSRHYLTQPYSGTGGAPKYGVVNQMPVKGTVPNPLVDLGQNRSSDDTGEVGYYRSSLANGINIEVAATEHAGMYQYSFPTGVNSIVVDVSHVLPSFRGLVCFGPLLQLLASDTMKGMGPRVFRRYLPS